MALAALSEPTEASLQEAFEVGREQLGTQRMLALMFDWSSRVPSRAALFESFIDEGLASERLERRDLIGGGATARRHLFSEAAYDIAQAGVRSIVAMAPGARPPAINALVAELKRVSPDVAHEEVAFGLLKALYEADLARVAPMAEADTQLGGVQPAAWADFERPGVERPTPARAQLQTGADLWGALPALNSFAPVEGLALMPVTVSEARASSPGLARSLDLLKVRAQFARSSGATQGAAELESAAEGVVTRFMGPALTSASGEEKLRLYSLGRALIDDVRDWVESGLEE